MLRKPRLSKPAAMFVAGTGDPSAVLSIVRARKDWNITPAEEDDTWFEITNGNRQSVALCHIKQDDGSILWQVLVRRIRTNFPLFKDLSELLVRAGGRPTSNLLNVLEEMLADRTPPDFEHYAGERAKAMEHRSGR